MSRGQETTAFNTATDQNAGYYSNAQNSYSNAQQDAGDFEKQLSTYAANNPYVAGGAFQTTTNQQLTNTSDAMARSVGSTLQSQALRTGQNTNGAIGATEQMEESNERNLSGQEAAATQQRLAAGAAYGKNVLDATGTAEQQQAALAGQQGGLSEGALGTEVKAGETPSWMDQFGGALATSLGKSLGSGARG